MGRSHEDLLRLNVSIMMVVIVIGKKLCPVFFSKTQIGRAHVWTPVTRSSRMPSSAWKKKRKHLYLYRFHSPYILTRSPSCSVIPASDLRGEQWQTQLFTEIHVGKAIPVIKIKQTHVRSWDILWLWPVLNIWGLRDWIQHGMYCSSKSSKSGDNCNI